MSTVDRPPRVAMKQWEEAGVSLLEAFNHYTDMCTRLDTNALDKEIAPVELTSRIDSTLEKVHTVILDQLPQTTSGLRKSRNALICSTSRFPDEVLLKIFGDVVFDYRSPHGEAPLPVKQSLQLSFARLYTLCSVCSTWRDIVVANGTLWSVIPLIVDQSTRELRPYQPSLERAGASQLHLAAVIDSSKARALLDELLSKYRSRFSTISLNVDRMKPRIVHEVVQWLSNDDVGSLSELSIRLQDGLPIVVTRAWDGSDRSRSPGMRRGGIRVPSLPSEHDYIFPRDSPQEVSFNKLLKSLTVLRISSVQIHWDSIAFSSRLVELLIHDVNFGYDDELAPFLQTLSSASELRDLKITAVRTFYRSSTPEANALPAISFPKLQSLFLGGLYFNTLKRILSMITPGSHSLTLSLNDQSWQVMRLPQIRSYTDPRGYDDTGYTYVEEQWAAFGPTQVDTLFIQCGDFWGSAALWAILRAIQGLKTLKIDNWYPYNRDDFSISGPKQPGGTQSSLEELLPTVEYLHFTRATIKNSDIPALKEMLAIHTLRQVVLGGKVDFSDDPQRSSCQSFQEYSDLVEWLRKEVPHARLVDEKYRSADVHSGWWRMW